MPEKPAKHPDPFKRFSRLLRETSRKPSSAHVHQLRTNARRLESAMQAANGDVPRATGKLLKQLAKLRKRAGKVRDLDIQLAALETVNIGREEKLKAELAFELEALRKKQTEKLANLLGSKSRARLQKRLRRAHTKPFNASTAEKRKYERQAQEELAKLMKQASEAAAFTPESLHKLRLGCKRARYLFELAPESAAAAHVIGQLRSVQDAVGDWHDWLTLSESAAKRLSAHSALLAALQNTTKARFSEAVRTVKNVMPEIRYTPEDQERRKPAARAAAEMPELKVNAASA